MEKLIYTFWDSSCPPAELKHRLQTELGPQLKVLTGIHHVQLNITDEYVADPVTPPRYRTDPAIAGIINVWVDSSYYRAALEALLVELVQGFHGYAVVESQPIVNTLHPPQHGQRTEGFSQVVILEKPDRLEYQQWLDLWLNRHTPVAIDTQSNFQYVQNIVQRAITDGAPLCHAIVEECFSLAALHDPYVFFNAKGDEAKFLANVKAMMESCERFIDQDNIDVIYTSQYVLA